jgi:chemotaxis protein methyltransferase CheR
MENSMHLKNPEEVNTNENIEITVFLEAVLLKYGYDFRNYSRVHIKRRILNFIQRNNSSSISELLYKMLYDENLFHSLLLDLSLNVTEMFRDPLFFKAIREIVVPYLQTYPFFKIWHAGCSSGEEVYSMAILLKEEGIYDRCIIYATDFNQVIIQKAKEAIFPLDLLKQYSANYFKADGKNSFSDYFIAKYDSALLNKNLKNNIVFSDHNLVNDGVFGEMNMIVCRNVLIYFNRDLQNKVHKLFYESLIHGGILCLGTKETLMFTDYSEKYTLLHKLSIYKKSY